MISCGWNKQPYLMDREQLEASVLRPSRSFVMFGLAQILGNDAFYSKGCFLRK